MGEVCGCNMFMVCFDNRVSSQCHRTKFVMFNLQSTMDELPDASTPATQVLGVFFLPHDIGRAQRWTTDSFLQVIFNVCRYSWHTHGVYPFLTESDKQSLAIVSWNCWSETAERRSDDLFNLSPLAHEGQSQVVTLRA